MRGSGTKNGEGVRIRLRRRDDGTNRALASARTDGGVRRLYRGTKAPYASTSSLWIPCPIDPEFPSLYVAVESNVCRANVWMNGLFFARCWYGRCNRCPTTKERVKKVKNAPRGSPLYCNQLWYQWAMQTSTSALQSRVSACNLTRKISNCIQYLLLRPSVREYVR